MTTYSKILASDLLRKNELPWLLAVLHNIKAHNVLEPN